MNVKAGVKFKFPLAVLQGSLGLTKLKSIMATTPPPPW